MIKRLKLAFRCFFITMKGGDPMRFANWLAYGIMSGELKWADITEAWRPAVKYWLNVYGIGTDGNPIMPNGVPTTEK